MSFWLCIRRISAVQTTVLEEREMKIPISEAKKIAEKYGNACVVIFGLDDDAMKFNVTTYGKTKKLCRHAASFGEQISNKIFNQEIAPETEEPKHLPEEATQFVADNRKANAVRNAQEQGMEKAK
jgi:hypothetical protein